MFCQLSLFSLPTVPQPLSFFTNLLFFQFNTYFSFKTMTYQPATRHAVLLYGTFESVVF